MYIAYKITVRCTYNFSEVLSYRSSGWSRSVHSPRSLTLNETSTTTEHINVAIILPHRISSKLCRLSCVREMATVMGRISSTIATTINHNRPPRRQRKSPSRYNTGVTYPAKMVPEWPEGKDNLPSRAAWQICYGVKFLAVSFVICSLANRAIKSGRNRPAYNLEMLMTANVSKMP